MRDWQDWQAERRKRREGGRHPGPEARQMSDKQTREVVKVEHTEGKKGKKPRGEMEIKTNRLSDKS